MEWVETTGRTVEDAKEAALDQLGVDESDAEFEVLEEARAGLFGRLRGEARVRARVRPTAPSGQGRPPRSPPAGAHQRGRQGRLRPSRMARSQLQDADDPRAPEPDAVGTPLPRPRPTPAGRQHRPPATGGAGQPAPA